MRTRISKHGKYRIYEGVEREVGDMLQPGDLLTANPVVGPPAQVEVITRLKDREQYDEFKDKLTPLDRLAFALFDVSGHEQMFFDENAYVVKTSGDKYTLWTPGGDVERDEAPVKIKRRITEDTGIVADTVIAGDIHADRINGAKKVEEAEPKVPTEPGLYRDRIDDYVLFHRVCGSEKLYYTDLTCGEKLSKWPKAYEVEGNYNVLQNYAPYTSVTAINDVEVEQ